MDYYYLYRSSRNGKKLMVVHRDKTIHFGASDYDDYITSNGDDNKKKRYIQRHQKNEDWNDLKKAGTWSLFILWNKPTLKQSIKNMMEAFNIRIIRKVDYP
jgi:hypothetical protein